MPLVGLLAGEAGGVRPRGGLLDGRERTGATGFVVAVFTGWEDLDCDTLESAGFAVPDDLKTELTFTDATGLEGSGFLAAADVVLDGGFLASEAEGGRPTSS